LAGALAAGVVGAAAVVVATGAPEAAAAFGLVVRWL
jgi:hypothetical protein